ncbi:MAG: TonB-dependent receptor, partial [Bacteroidota bacterium]
AQNKPCTHSISGKVLDAETKAPIPYVTVKVEGEEKYTLTDEQGKFVLEGLCSDVNTLVISSLGYSNARSQHDREHSPLLNIYLSPELVGLDEVTIQAKKNNEKGVESISQIKVSKAEIVSDPTQSLASALSSIQGVTFTSTGTNVQLPVIHGLSGNRILVLNNGFKHGFQNWGRDHAPEIDVNSANSVTVIKGAAGVRYGPEALGGAIVVESNPLLLNNPFYANIGTGYQTNGRGYNANMEIGNGTENWSYFLNGNFVKIGDRQAPDYNLTNTGKEETAFSFGVLRHLKDWDFKLQYSFIDQNLALLRATFLTSPDNFIRAINTDRPLIVEPFSYNIDAPNQTVQHHLTKAEINWWYSDEGKLTFRGGI